jgi:hypothetical protein
MLRLTNAFGLCCYSISPLGARKFLDHCFPLRESELFICEVNLRVGNYGIDVAMNHLYCQSQSYVCFPPLAATANDHAISTVQNGIF